ncbi:hypothetical protein EJ02DRAFT_19166 [Clathrospora elynae]|uniref:Uncharacterized protein n=1 Tax=Clathrospora elynae TaxID=706981 RepID=A0A6A5SMZ8_9PLEO|nr:hypothetical protein EJ02DRAFT_19166 [Clathrospora elynae]
MMAVWIMRKLRMQGDDILYRHVPYTAFSSSEYFTAASVISGSHCEGGPNSRNFLVFLGSPVAASIVSGYLLSTRAIVRYRAVSRSPPANTLPVARSKTHGERLRSEAREGRDLRFDTDWGEITALATAFAWVIFVSAIVEKTVS